jgi:hypothetical protein
MLINPNMRLGISAALAVAVASALAAPSAAAAQAPPQIPATFYGTVTVGGSPAREGAEVRAYIDGKDCTQAGAPGAVVDGGVTRFVISVVHETQVPGCGVEGAEVTFEVDGEPASPGATWTARPQQVDLEAEQGVTASPAASLTASPPSPGPGPRLSADDEGGSPIGAIAWTGIGLGAAALLAAAGWFAARRKFKGKAW